MKSVWTEKTKIREREPLPGDMEAPAVVIGAGLAGILTAYYLKQAGIRAVVLEADRIGSGQTKNTTAKITSQHNLLYSRLIRTFGHRMAEHYASANEAAIGEYERLVFERQASFHPLKFLAKMAEEVEVYEQTKVLKVEEGRVETAKGTVTAGHIVFASHFPFINFPGYYFARMHQERSYVMTLEGAEQLEGMYLGIDGDRLSFRTYGDMLLLGGGSHRTGVNKGNKADECGYGVLSRKAREFYPGCREVLRWSAQDCMTLDGLPYIGRFSRRRPGWYVATGFGKWGMTTAMVSARILTALISGRDCSEADIFSPQRHFSARAAKELAVHGLYTVKGLAKHLLPAGKGSVIPNCPHMGCRLEWNPDEESYDCPCHGSRFDREGCLIDGPAQTDCGRKVEGE